MLPNLNGISDGTQRRHSVRTVVHFTLQATGKTRMPRAAPTSTLRRWIHAGDSRAYVIWDPRSIHPATKCFHTYPKTDGSTLLPMDTRDMAALTYSSLTGATARMSWKTSASL